MERIKMLPAIAGLFVILISFSISSANAQTFTVSGFETGKSEIDDNIRKQLEAVADTGSTQGLAARCEAGEKVLVNGYSNYVRFKNVSKEESDRLNDSLALRRIQTSVRFYTDQLGLPEDCFSESSPIYADSKIKAVRFTVVSTQASIQAVLERIKKNGTILDEISTKLDSLHQKDKQQDERLDDHDGRIADNSGSIDRNKTQIDSNEKRISENEGSISENSDRFDTVENRLTVLESQVNRGVSTYISLASISFAGETTPAFEAGTRLGDVRLSGWFGYWKDYAANLDEGLRDFDRMLAGASATWYALNTRYVDAGPSIGAQWTHDEIEQEITGVDCRFIYYSALIGADLTAKIGPVDLFGNVSWSPTKEIVRGDIHRNTNPLFIKAGLRVNLN